MNTKDISTPAAPARPKGPLYLMLTPAERAQWDRVAVLMGEGAPGGVASMVTVARRLVAEYLRRHDTPAGS